MIALESPPDSANGHFSRGFWRELLFGALGRTENASEISPSRNSHSKFAQSHVTQTSFVVQEINRKRFDELTKITTLMWRHRVHLPFSVGCSLRPSNELLNLHGVDHSLAGLAGFNPLAANDLCYLDSAVVDVAG